VLVERVRKTIAEWAAEEGWQDLPVCELERPAQEAHGDYATPVCMQMAKTVRQPPRALAEKLRERLLADPEIQTMVEQIDIAGPGFINFTLSGQAFGRAMSQLLAEGETIGAGAARDHPRMNLEFVSVNPNGPLHVGHGRYAAYGDSLKRLLAFSGTNISTEFYINDFGRQMDRFGRSVAARYAQSFGLDVPVPHDGYQRAYVADIAAGIRAEVGDRYVAALSLAAVKDRGRVDERALSAATSDGSAEVDAPVEAPYEDDVPEGPSEWPDDPALSEAVAFFRARGCAAELDEMRQELEQFGVVFDCWFSETTLHTSGRLEKVVKRLLDMGEAFEEGGAVWVRTTSRGDDKDRVVVRANGQPTYFAADIAYHENKLERGFDHLINIWGADHHGYVSRMKAAVEILSGRPGTLEVIIGQLVNLLEKGELRQMSTRRGEMVTLAELVKAIGVDAARFFLVTRSQDQTLDLDIDLARRQSQDNPV